jgi:large subunit ribosomal protein L25
MEKVVLHAKRRTVVGKQVRALRRAGQLPGVLYGHNVDPIAISLDYHDATRGLVNVTSSTIVTLDVDGKEYATLVREKQRDYIRNMIKHIDFQAVSLTEKIKVKVGIEHTGVAPAVKDFNGVIVNGIDEVEIECLPQYLLDKIVVDLSVLEKIGDGIHVRDLVIPEHVTVLEESDEMVVLVTAPAAEEVEEATTEEEGAITEPELIERGKKDEEEIDEK